MINRVVLLGRLTKDPELRYTPSGVAVATFTLAVDRRFSNQQGERETDFIFIVAWRQLAELCANYLKKGQQAAVEGRLQTRSYENRDGQKVYVTEVVADNVQFLSPPRSAQTPGFERTAPAYGIEAQKKQPHDDPFADDGQEIDLSDDDLPF